MTDSFIYNFINKKFTSSADSLGTFNTIMVFKHSEHFDRFRDDRRICRVVPKGFSSRKDQHYASRMYFHESIGNLFVHMYHMDRLSVWDIPTPLLLYESNNQCTNLSLVWNNYLFAFDNFLKYIIRDEKTFTFKTTAQPYLKSDWKYNYFIIFSYFLTLF